MKMYSKNFTPHPLSVVLFETACQVFDEFPQWSHCLMN
ncbi:hypothetical protein OROHE_024908 [Orobanche hederae]